MNHSELEDPNAGMIEFLTLANARQAEEINFLRQSVIELQSIVGKLTDKLTGAIQRNKEISNESFEPIGGFKNLRMKIFEAEKASRDEADKLNEG